MATLLERRVSEPISATSLLLLEGDMGGRLLLEGDMQIGSSDRLRLEGDMLDADLNTKRVGPVPMAVIS